MDDVDVDSLVVGDVIHCTEGMKIPADAIIVDSLNHDDCQSQYSILN